MFQNFIDNINDNPVLLAGIAQVIFPVLVVFEIVHWTEAQTAVLYTAITAVCGAFVRGKTVASNRLAKTEQLVEEKVAHREMAGTTGTGDGLKPAATPGPATPGLSIFFALAVGGSVLASGCGPKLPPTTSPEGKIAIRATQVTESLRATLPKIKALTCQPSVPPPVCIPPKDALMVVTNIDRAGDAALELARVLVVIDDATATGADKATGLQRARNLLAGIQELLTKSILVPQGADIQTALATVFSTVSAILFMVM